MFPSHTFPQFQKCLVFGSLMTAYMLLPSHGLKSFFQSRNKSSKVGLPLGCAPFLLVTFSGLQRELIGFVEHEAIETAMRASIRLCFQNHF